MPRKGRTRKKTRTHTVDDEAAASAIASNHELKIPRSLVVRRGKVESEVIDLVSDLRKLMMPYTALNFEEDSKNKKLNKSLSHYAKELTGALGLTHILSISQNQSKLALRLARTPAGPTLTFKIQQFSLSKQIRQVQRRPFDINSSTTKITTHPPIVVTNNFGDATASPHVKLMRITFQNMFPAINVASVKLSDCRRVVLFNFIRREEGHPEVNDSGQSEEDEEVEVRHYAIRATPVGVNRKVRKIIQAKIPNLSKVDDIGDYIMGQTVSGAPATAVNGAVSDSEAEDETSHVVLSQKYAGKGNNKSMKSALKLVELGPRLRLKLTKVERGLGNGDVMYHAYVHKTPDEIKTQRDKVQKEVNLKKHRRDEQEENVRKKQAALELKRDNKKRRRIEREKAAMDELRGQALQDSDDESDVSED